jgi:hypothetical protein
VADPGSEESVVECARRIRRRSVALRLVATTLRAESEQARCELEIARSSAHLAGRRARDLAP